MEPALSRSPRPDSCGPAPHTPGRAWRIALAVFGLLAGAPLPAAAAESPTVSAIRARGSVVCGMQSDNPPFSLPDSQGVWRGMDVDSCRALAAAVFGDPSKITV